ncbi:MAG: hypothetical protein WBA17_09210 [Saprospiraceae bacterium]
MYRSALPACFFLLLFLFPACEAERVESELAEQPFFSLTDYFAGEITRLADHATPVRKSVMLNGETEEKTLPNLDFSRELTIFQQADINKPAWYEKYRVDSMTTADGRLSGLRYTALDTTLVTRELAVEMNGRGEPAEIQVVKRSGNVLSRGFQRLTYRPDAGYTIEATRTSSLTKDMDSRIEVSF